ncbi:MULTISPECIES: hypothetical protein [unclassified Treponema]|uniref:hypothetical protein n=1 Tax=unclassified Treponema TaxID=2638727 RepID=UPI0020A28BB7|nr:MULTISPECIES: hypothetical protein [unclassified Treponema]UTC66774.1 hypothetical protein E4O06_12625 [Treponema sp. OMZ 789]UTC69507.1 hypothetical protein E4O01_12765 [Treponema sp. OMZ 790]UTC72221.1 hypothetical protein E4O02_12860 [Treponema sp. OMZ 791]
MKKYFIFIIFIICLAFSTFAESRRITVKQSIRYSDGQYVELLSPQISKSKAVKTNKGNVILKYDFFVEKSSTYSDIVCLVIFPNNTPVYPTGLDGAYKMETKVEDSFFQSKDITILEKNDIANIIKVDDDFNAIPIIIPAKKGNKAILEFQLNVLNYNYDTINIAIFFGTFVTKQSENSFFHKIKPFIRGFFVVPHVMDIFSGEFQENPFEDSIRYYTLLVKE